MHMLNAEYAVAMLEVHMCMLHLHSSIALLAAAGLGHKRDGRTVKIHCLQQLLMAW